MSWALILGVSGGTGSAIARAVAHNPGLDVFGIHRGNYPDAAALVKQEVESVGRRADFLLMKAGNAELAAVGAEQVLARIGPRSVKLFVHAIANASVGLLASNTPEQLSSRQIQKSFDSMAHSFVYWTQELLARDLLAPEARLLGLANPMDDTVVSGTAVIAACKAALGAYVRHLAHELGPRGHRVNLLKFGAITTAAVRRTFGEQRLERLQAVLGQAIPARRMCRPDEVGQFVSILAGDAGSWFNGATIDFTGGEFQGLMNVLLREERNDTR